MPRARYSKRGLRIALKKAVNISGIEDLERGLVQIGQAAGEEAVEVLRKAGRVGRAEIRSRIPSRRLAKSTPEQLRKAVFFDASDPFHVPEGPSILIGVNHKMAPDWHWLELGTENQRAHPFIRPGIQAAGPKMKQIVEQGVKQIVEKGAK